MEELRRYKKKASAYVIAVKLELDTAGFTYRKWGGEQFCKAGDWIVYNNSDTYTIDQDTFTKTYEKVSPGLYVKSSIVWAETANHSGVIKTKKGETHYKSGDYMIYNDLDRKDGYAIDAATFKSLYELIE